MTAFGAFVDIGVHQDGLVHISELADRFVKNPGDVVKVHQKVNVTVLEVDLQRKRISLSMKSPQAASAPAAKKEAARPMPKPEIRPDKQNRRPAQFSNNPFYEALRKK